MKSASPGEVQTELGQSVWRDIIDSLTAALIVVSPTLQLVTLNPSAETLLGGSQTIRLESVLRDNPWLVRMVRDCLENRKDLTLSEAVLSCSERRFTVRTEVSPLLDDSAGLGGAIMLIDDLSHQRGVEQTITTDENDQEPAAMLGLSPAGLAHEIKNPLTGIKGAAELLVTMFPADSRARQYCGLIFDGVDRIAGLVEQVLSVSGPQPLKKEPVNIHQVLHHAMRMAGLFFENSGGVTVDQQFDPSLPEVMADQAALERVFINLLRNAIEAITAPGKICLRTRMETEFHLTAGGRRRRFLRVEVSDSGCGLSAAQQAQLFRPFFTTKAAGTGLGLVLSQRIVALHGGKLWAERCEQLGGMTFKVTLPLV